jgi:hypothetical protein
VFGLVRIDQLDADDLPPGTLAAAREAVALGQGEAELWPALRRGPSALFAERRKTNHATSDQLEPKLRQFLDLIEHDPNGWSGLMLRGSARARTSRFPDQFAWAQSRKRPVTNAMASRPR